MDVFTCVEQGNLDIVKEKLKNDDRLILECDENQRTLLHIASLHGHEDIVSYLLKLKSPIDAVDDNGYTPLILAASVGFTEVVRLLTSNGAKIDWKNNQGHSALQYACSRQREIVKILFAYNADVNIVDVNGESPLHRATARLNIRIVELLLEEKNKININLKNSSEETALHLACREDHRQLAIMLREAGASLYVKNKQKLTPLDLCKSEQMKNDLKNIADIYFQDAH